MLTPGRFPLRASCHTVNAEAPWRYFSSQPHLSSTVHGWPRECINLNIPNQQNLHTMQPQLTSDDSHEMCHMKLDGWVRPRPGALRGNRGRFQAAEFWGGLLCQSRGTGTTPALDTPRSECLHQMEWVSTLTLSGWRGTPPACCLFYGLVGSLPVVNVFTDPWGHGFELPLSFLSSHVPGLLRNSLAPASQTEAGLLPSSKTWLFSVSCPSIHAFFLFIHLFLFPGLAQVSSWSSLHSESTVLPWFPCQWWHLKLLPDISPISVSVLWWRLPTLILCDLRLSIKGPLPNPRPRVSHGIKYRQDSFFPGTPSLPVFITDRKWWVLSADTGLQCPFLAACIGGAASPKGCLLNSFLSL